MVQFSLWRIIDIIVIIACIDGKQKPLFTLSNDFVTGGEQTPILVPLGNCSGSGRGHFSNFVIQVALTLLLSPRAGT
jgi:hypothetical protein